MVEIAAVTEPKAGPQKGKLKPKSDIGFPYYSLEKSIEVARIVHERAGGRCGRSQLAPLIGYSGVKNGGFLTRISAAKMFGLIDEFNESITLTERAKKILAPVRLADAEQAKVDAFMSVELFRRVYEDFEGNTLPAEVGLRNLFENQYKIVPKQVPNALRTMLESADAAGMFKLAGNRSKLIVPLMQSGVAAPAVDDGPPPKQEFDDSPPRRYGGSGGGGSEDGGGSLPGVHPALAGLIQNLPPVGSKLGPKRRSALIDAFKSTINFIYPEDEE